LTRTSLHDYRLGQILDGLFAVNLGSCPLLVICHSGIAWHPAEFSLIYIRHYRE
jgi:hypothetical protein